MKFAKTLKELRKNINMTQQEVSCCLGIGRTTYTQYETGVSEPNFQTLCALADYFGVTTDQLLGRAPLPNTNEESEVKTVTKDQTQRLEECLLAFVERVSNSGATTEAEVQVLPAIAQVLVNLNRG